MGKTVCFFNSCRTWGGGEKWHFDMAVRLAKQGYPVVAAVYPGSELSQRLNAFDISRIEVRVTKLSFLNPWKVWKIRKRLQEFRVGTVILNLPSDVKAAGVAAKLAGVPNVMYRRGSATPVRNTHFNRFLFHRVVDRVVVNSEATKRSFEYPDRKLIASEKIRVIHNGIDLEAFDRTHCPSLYRPPNGAVVLGTAGRMEPQKNQRFLIEVAAILKQRGVAFKLLIAGKGRLENELRTLASDRQLQEEVVFLGFVENTHAFMQSLDIFLLSSLWEGFGYVLIEAMACGKPVVTLNSSSEPEVVVDGETGFVVAHPDPVLFAEKLMYLIRHRDVRNNLGRQGRERVRKRFTIQRCVEELKGLLHAA